MTAPAHSLPAVRGGPAGPTLRRPAREHGGAAAAPVPAAAPSKGWVSRRAEVWVAIAVMSSLALLVIPLPPVLLDGLLAVSIACSVVVLLVTLATRDPLEFNIFPSLLLLLTLLRLGLNVSSTRLILSTGSAGRVIAAFGDAVIGGNYVVGLVIFLILVVINFTVITKGAGRIAEVAARFTLDAMPGRQMSIDADLSAGLIDETEAKRRREEIARYADFYGAMDGAAKFVRGDAVAGLLITAINLIGGFVIGMTQQGLSASESLSTYTVLSVGDGLVSQIPALIVSTAAGILVTFGSGGTHMGPVLQAQLTRHPTAIWMASSFLLLIAIMPGFPAPPFLLLSGLTAAIAAWAQRRDQIAGSFAAAPTSAAAADAPTPLKELLQVDALELEVGYALVSLVDAGHQGDLLQRISLIRAQLAIELGIVVPPARVRDNIQLPSTEYCIKVRGAAIARGEVLPGHVLAVQTAGAGDLPEGIRTTDPSFGMPAVWLQPDRRSDAEARGHTVVEPQTVLATHLMEAIRQHAADLLGRQEARELLDGLKERNPALVDDLVPGKLPLAAVHRVLQRLLREGVPIRDLTTILETLADSAERTKDPELLTEDVRRALSKTLLRLYEDADGTIRGITIGPRLEMALYALFGPASREPQRTPSPDELSAALQRLGSLVTSLSHEGRRRPLVSPPALRIGIRRLLEPVLPTLPVVSLAELPPQAPIQSLATWELPLAP
jgi:flagellar biosynthesis protein FlhA